MSWILLRFWTFLVYLFMFLPIGVVILLSFNANQFGGFPITGFSFRWFIRLANNDAILRAFETSLLLGALTAIISTTLGVLASLALIRYKVLVECEPSGDRGWRYWRADAVYARGDFVNSGVVLHV